MTSHHEHNAHASAVDAIARAQAHVPDPDDWPPPTPTGLPLHRQYPITPAGARARRLHLQEETRNA